MSNNEVDVDIVSTLAGQGFQALDEQFKLAQEDTQAYQDHLVELFNAGELSVQEFVQEVKASTAELNAFGQSINQVKATADEAAGVIQATTSETRGLRMGAMEAVIALQLMQSALGDKLPQSAQEASKGLMMVADGMMAGMMLGGPVGAAIGGVTSAVLALGIAALSTTPEIQALNKELDTWAHKDDAIKSLKDLAGVTQDEAAQAREWAKAHSDASAELERLTRGVEDAQKHVEFVNEGFKLHRATLEEVNAADKALTDAQSALAYETDYLSGKQKEATDALTAHQGASSSLTGVMGDTTASFDTQAHAIDRAAAAMQGYIGSTTLAGQMQDYLQTEAMKTADALDKQVTALAAAQVNQNMMRADQDPNALGAFTLKEEDAISKPGRDKAIADAKREADALAKFQDEVADASAAASPKIISNFELIANSAGDAAQKTAELHAYINSLPKDVKAKIELAIQFGGNMGLANQLGMGGGAQAASRDWTKEWEATFAQQSGAIQQKFVQDAGGNKDDAIKKWQEQHKLEVLGQMQADPGQFTNVQGPAADIQKGLMGQLGNTKMSDPLMQGLTKDTKGMQAVGDAMGRAIGGQAAQTVAGMMADSSSTIANALFDLLDGRYQKLLQPSSYKGPS